MNESQVTTKDHVFRVLKDEISDSLSLAKVWLFFSNIFDRMVRTIACSIKPSHLDQIMQLGFSLGHDLIIARRSMLLNVLVTFCFKWLCVDPSGSVHDFFGQALHPLSLSQRPQVLEQIQLCQLSLLSLLPIRKTSSECHVWPRAASYPLLESLYFYPVLGEIPRQ